MRLSELNIAKRAEAGAWMTVKDDVGNDTPIRFKLRGLESYAVAAVIKEWKKENADRDEKDVKALQAFGINLLTTYIMDWENVLDDNDKPIPCTPEKIREMVSDIGYDNIVVQINDFVRERSNFFTRADVP